MSKDPYYFTHDANASHDPKIQAMMKKYGVSGYGMFWIIIERLRNESGYKLSDRPYNWDALAMQMQCTSEHVKEFVKDCCEQFDLLVMDDGFFYSGSLLKRMIHLDSIREKRVRAAQSMHDKKDKENAW